jgi:hypothetical protein
MSTPEPADIPAAYGLPLTQYQLANMTPKAVRHLWRYIKIPPKRHTAKGEQSR